MNSSHFIVKLSSHTEDCLPNPSKEVTTGFKNELKRKALASDVSPVKLVNGVLSSLGPSSSIVSEQGRSYAANAKLVSRTRKANLPIRAPEPPDLASIPESFFDDFKRTSKDDSFLIHDDGPLSNERIVLFGAGRSISRILAQSRIW